MASKSTSGISNSIGSAALASATVSSGATGATSNTGGSLGVAGATGTEAATSVTAGSPTCGFASCDHPADATVGSMAGAPAVGATIAGAAGKSLSLSPATFE